MSNIKGSKTEKNLMEAFAGESQARNKYTYFASAAKKDGYEQIAQYFLESAENEKEHAKIWAKLLGIVGSTEQNLEVGANGENEEWTSMYPNFANIAREEGYNDIAFLFEKVANIEKEHEQRYRKLLANLREAKIFTSTEGARWVCRNCGHVHFGTKAPELCPVCKHPQAYFEIKAENY